MKDDRTRERTPTEQAYDFDRGMRVPDAERTMTEDLPCRLRAEVATILKIRREKPGYGTSTFLLADAADEIERLRVGIADLCNCQFKGDLCGACDLLGRDPD